MLRYVALLKAVNGCSVLIDKPFGPEDTSSLENWGHGRRGVTGERQLISTKLFRSGEATVAIAALIDKERGDLDLVMRAKKEDRRVLMILGVHWIIGRSKKSAGCQSMQATKLQ